VIVTSHHVVEHEDRIRIGLPGGETVTGTLSGVTRIPIWQSFAPKVRPDRSNMAEAEEVRVGHLALAVGRPGDDLANHSRR